jgi:hypothetical protein
MKFWTTVLCGALLAGLGAGSALAGPSMDWDPAFTWESGATPTSSMPDSEFKAVGIIDFFDVPFGDLDPVPGVVEYTFYVYGLISNGTTSFGSPGSQLFVTTYHDGFIEIYCDSTPEPAVFDPNPPNGTVPSNFVDGTLILSGSFNSFFTQTNDFTANQSGNLEGEITWTGGTLIDRTENGAGQPCTGLFTGGITWKPSVLIPGYIFRNDGKLDLNCPVPTEPKTWGQIKSMYR